LSKAERDAIDIQKVADMERLLNTTALKKMTTKGPDDPMKELDEMIGLEPMKTAVKEMVARMEFENQERKKNKKNKTNEAVSTRHFCMTGSPGTGKTTTARILTSFLYKYGYIKENKCVEIDGNFLKAGTESALKTELVLRHAYGGVLFIDEAYSLMDSSDNSGEQV
jgi:stage V sporulation protein K